jgi:hypothetical protein
MAYKLSLNNSKNSVHEKLFVSGIPRLYPAVATTILHPMLEYYAHATQFAYRGGKPPQRANGRRIDHQKHH